MIKAISWNCENIMKRIEVFIFVWVEIKYCQQHPEKTTTTFEINMHPWVLIIKTCSYLICIIESFFLFKSEWADFDNLL